MTELGAESGYSSVVLISSYELGHQPAILASVAAALRAAGHRVRVVDAAVEEVTGETWKGAHLVAISVPMLTALRLGQRLAEEVRRKNPSAHLCLFGLYAWMNGEHLLDTVADSVTAGEVEPALVALAGAVAASDEPDIAGMTTRVSLRRDGRLRPPRLERVSWRALDRFGLPPLERYARLLGPAEGERRVAGYIEASRGCKHRCRHCPVVPVYDGRFFIVPIDVVLADAEQQINRGARHLTIGDPDFLNAPTHAFRLAHALHDAFPNVTFDVTAKVEHILRHRERMAELARLGCAFLVTAVESLSNRVLTELDKGHTRQDVIEAVRVLRAAPIAIRPSFIPFTPWSTLDDYVELIDFVQDEGLVDNVDPIQLSIRLLVPPASALLWPRNRRRLRDGRPAPGERPSWLGSLQPEAFSYRWQHPDPRMDRLHEQVCQALEREVEGSDRSGGIFERIAELAYRSAGRCRKVGRASARRGFVPRLTESWFCCAEPHRGQLERVSSRTSEGGRG